MVSDFERFLMDKHAEQYSGLDDEMVDELRFSRGTRCFRKVFLTEQHVNQGRFAHV